MLFFLGVVVGALLMVLGPQLLDKLRGIISR